MAICKLLQNFQEQDFCYFFNLSYFSINIIFTDHFYSPVIILWEMVTDGLRGPDFKPELDISQVLILVLTWNQ